MNEEQAIALSKTAFWKDLSYEEIVKFQLLNLYFVYHLKFFMKH